VNLLNKQSQPASKG